VERPTTPKKKKMMMMMKTTTTTTTTMKEVACLYPIQWMAELAAEWNQELERDRLRHETDDVDPFPLAIALK
jgi:hypothetical protein